MNKLERDGKVAVIVSPGYGAGWSTWNDYKYQEILCLDAEIAQAVLNKNLKEVIRLAKEKCDSNIYFGGVDDLKIEWVPKRERFEIGEYDGYEELIIISNRTYNKCAWVHSTIKFPGRQSRRTPFRCANC